MLTCRTNDRLQVKRSTPADASLPWLFKTGARLILRLVSKRFLSLLVVFRILSCVVVTGRSIFSATWHGVERTSPDGNTVSIT